MINDRATTLIAATSILLQPASQQKVYNQGRQDCAIYGQVPPANQVQEWMGLTGEETVCYLNGVGDALAAGEAN